MLLKTVIIFCALCFTVLAAAQQKTAGRPRVSAAQAQAVASTGKAQAAQGGQSQTLRDDLKKMRALVEQMETNLAFVDTTQTPLKHQFQLEIEMWKTLIEQMERRTPANAH